MNNGLKVSSVLLFDVDNLHLGKPYDVNITKDGSSQVNSFVGLLIKMSEMELTFVIYDSMGTREKTLLQTVSALEINKFGWNIRLTEMVVPNDEHKEHNQFPEFEVIFSNGSTPLLKIRDGEVRFCPDVIDNFIVDVRWVFLGKDKQDQEIVSTNLRLSFTDDYKHIISEEYFGDKLIAVNKFTVEDIINRFKSIKIMLMNEWNGSLKEENNNE